MTRSSDLPKIQDMLALRAIGLLALGAIWFVLALAWPPFLWIGLAHNAALIGLIWTDRARTRDSTHVRMRRGVPDPLSLGVEQTVTLTLNHLGRSPFDVRIRDDVPSSFETRREPMAQHVPPRSRIEVPYAIRPQARGPHHFGRAHVRYATPWRLWVRQIDYPLQAEARVYPDIRSVKLHELLARRDQLTRIGMHVSRVRGTGLEFESLREYVPDDDLRRIDWKASARHGELVTREYDLERSRRLMLVVDGGRTMADQIDGLTKLDHAVNAALLLAHVALQSDDRVGLMTFADEIHDLTLPREGSGQIDAIAERLYGLQPRRREASYQRAAVRLAHRLRKRALIVLFTDLVDPDSSRRLIRALTTAWRRHMVLCVALRDPAWDERLRSAPDDATALYEQSMTLAVMDERQQALRKLNASGVWTIDACPSQLSVETVNRYLRAKQAARF
ncbi:MAG: DUF58 domain-containing protein [Salinibacter sp.]